MGNRSLFTLLNYSKNVRLKSGVSNIISRMLTHVKCRNEPYPYSQKSVIRLLVPEEKIPWSFNWPDYDPPTFSVVTNKPWEDPELTDPNFKPKWNEVDGHIDRRSFNGRYNVNVAPLNIVGRTGLKGRGRLGKWGPNHAADPVVTRWKRNLNGSKIFHSETKQPILQFVAIERQDSHEWAIPGGMVDPNEHVSETLKREFCEEAINSLSLTDNEKESLNQSISSFFQNGEEVYKGYVDDPRNTDNAWMETVVQNFHDESGESVGKLPLAAGDDAVNVQWMDLNSNMNLYANHTEFLKEVASRLESHW